MYPTCKIDKKINHWSLKAHPGSWCVSVTWPAAPISLPGVGALLQTDSAGCALCSGLCLLDFFFLPPDSLASAARMPGLLLGDVFPDFEADSTVGRIKLHAFLGKSWVTRGAEEPFAHGLSLNVFLLRAQFFSICAFIFIHAHVKSCTEMYLMAAVGLWYHKDGLYSTSYLPW